MADETTTQGVEGSGETPPEGAGQASQEDVQGQETSQTAVGQSGDASSEGQQAGKDRMRWSTERKMERLLTKKLDEKLTPLMEKLQSLSTPAAQPTIPDELPKLTNYDDINGWLDKAVKVLTEREIRKALPQNLSKFEDRLQSVTRTQEARNYLISQKDIGHDKTKHEEIQEIILNDPILSHSVDAMPRLVVEQAIDRWRKSRTNPNAPTKGQLGTVSGGTGIDRTGKREVSIEELRAMQDKLINNPTIEDKQKIEAEVNALIMQGM